MPDCMSKQLECEPVKCCRIEVNFEGGDVSGYGGLALVRKSRSRLGLIDTVARALADLRDHERIKHGLADMRHHAMMNDNLAAPLSRYFDENSRDQAAARLRRKAPGPMPIAFLNTRLNAASD